MLTSAELLRPIDPEAPLLVVATRAEAEHLGSDYPLLLTGIGRIRTAVALTEVLARGPLPREIINIGTAGALSKRCEDAGVYHVGSVSLHDFSHSAIKKLTGQTAYPNLTISHAPEAVRLTTGDVFVEDATLRRRLAKYADIVDMEGYAIAWVARRFDLPVSLIKMVSDQANKNAGKLWAEGVEECSKVMGAYLQQAEASDQE